MGWAPGKIAQAPRCAAFDCLSCHDFAIGRCPCVGAKCFKPQLPEGEVPSKIHTTGEKHITFWNWHQYAPRSFIYWWMARSAIYCDIFPTNVSHVWSPNTTQLSTIEPIFFHCFFFTQEKILLTKQYKFLVYFFSAKQLFTHEETTTCGACVQRWRLQWQITSQTRWTDKQTTSQQNPITW